MQPNVVDVRRNLLERVSLVRAETDVPNRENAMVRDVGGGTAIPLEADSAAMRSTSSELQTYVYSLTDSASTVNFDVQSVAGS